ncbi:FtsP/CotA-like multicopper oxidase with cupredoxin domain [Acetoanaerobium pronyense]|uniref:FtsP/CotA-like multicopper oxidase with cupredoxin domain n=1 Tax=Acetoanaerobium pronyense TaxID=1482736 RepID=A0ABS4KLS5_9FIRM|nr:multicopper oxidase domain-containing protein [Acetoanaerobium pronyense]MBP2028739.1 FtsP/CotA-like multicopper oxidase with cupredoxin domain [Acetoanaerobium pronyense]
MDNKMKFFIALIVILSLAGLLIFSNLPLVYNILNTNPQDANLLSNETLDELFIPEILENESEDPSNAIFSLEAKKGSKTFFQGINTPTYGYNGDFLGPVIRVNKGQNVTINVRNSLDEHTTTHWHGLIVDGDNDGGPHQMIKSDEIWEANFMIEQPAATLWYHPHIMDITGKQVYMGLAGLFYIDDEISASLDIPKDYGVDDIPLIIQDRSFDRNGNLVYDFPQNMMNDGMIGDIIMINGTVNPNFQIRKDLMRFRILNGSNANLYTIRISDNSTFYQIASDGGFLEKPVSLKELTLSSGERAEILVDFSSYTKGDVPSLVVNNNTALNFEIDDVENSSYAIPEYLTEVPRIDIEKASNQRAFRLQGMGNMVSINGKIMDMSRIDEFVSLNSTEIWEVTTVGQMMHSLGHPFHIHGVKFQVISRNDNPPPENEMGWKDTVMVYPAETVKVIMQFTKPGLFMYHCHNLEHEDAGMMGQFKVE